MNNRLFGFMRRSVLEFILLILFIYSASSEEIIINSQILNYQAEYQIRLTNGDLITGYAIEQIEDEELGKGIRFKTELGIAPIYESQIAEIIKMFEENRQSNRIYLQPTAKPISGNYFAGLYELFFIYLGGGITDWVSVTAGSTILPQIAPGQQLSNFNAKITFYNERFDNFSGGVALAAGGNMSFMNHNNRLVHFYGAATFTGDKSIINGTIFYKAGSDDFYTIRVGDNSFNMIYEDGSVGIGLGLDTKFSSYKGLHFIGELWNSNVAKPSNTAVLLGFRLANSSFSADFGLTIVTKPWVLPFTSFSWTPF